MGMSNIPINVLECRYYWGIINIVYMAKIMHVYNRGVDKRQVFMDRLDAWRFVRALHLFNSTKHAEFYKILNEEGELRKNRIKQWEGADSPLVNIHAYCLCINHFHLVLEEVEPDGISLFMKKLGGYTNYFNTRHDRTGNLFSGTYKRRDIDNEEDLFHVSAYVHKNYFMHDIEQDNELLWSSYTDLFERDYPRKGFLVDVNLVERVYGNLAAHKKHIDETVRGIKEKRLVSKLYAE